MKTFSTVARNYPVSGGIYPSKKQPSAAKQTDGFAPTYINTDGKLIEGDSVEVEENKIIGYTTRNSGGVPDSVEVAELNFIFNDLYAQAAHIDQLLTAKGK